MTTIVGQRNVEVPAGGIRLEGDLSLPGAARGVVIFAHGSGSSRFSRRNRYVAHRLQSRQIGTLLFDLLTADEEDVDNRTRHLRFDIELLAGRLIEAALWLLDNGRTRGLPLAYFGASTGAGAALVAAARRPESIRAIVSRGGRPDLAGAALTEVRAPTLLIVGGNDESVIDLNKAAFRQLHCEKELQIVPGATHLFEEPGALERVGELAAGWFMEWLR